ncbi:uncharacterized protein L3040_003365 [Drepanopeziza brunnea f. sp. 'multigermtubi']|uniref:uncharacterized protein n=1 Tax=Drepanopeziza brunnea f. sp. 'multigermtubi' TaxID=698441 RepID=UPI002385C5FE|nr:hypothetical protein L3040_003365 [Drepanopeziza brunnea f. sp. 'multigermtubi']
MRARLLPLVFLLPLLSLGISPVQEVLNVDARASPLDTKLRQLVHESMEEWHVPGISIGVVDGDEFWAEGYGIASFPDTPVTPSTLFYGASTTKAFTSAALALLIYHPTNFTSLSWKTPVSSLIPSDFVLEDEWTTSHLTIEDILSHRTGMPRHDLSYGGHYEGRNATPEDIVRALSYLLETLTGMSLGDFLRESIWEPLGMSSTYFSNEDALASPSHLAQGYVHHNGTYQKVPYMDTRPVSGAGSIISNVQDYSKWLHALINESPPIPKDAYKSLFTPRMLMDRNDDSPLPYTGPESYSLGWITSVYRGHQFYEHSGGMEAFGAQIIFFPELKYGLCSFGNTGVTSNNVELKAIWKLIDDKLGVPPKERFDWDKKFRKQMQSGKEQYDNRTAQYYPKIPSPPLPPTLPLEDYAGTYFQPAYRNVTIYKEQGVLKAHRDDVSWKLMFDLEHISGDYFMAHIDSTTAPGLIFRQAVAAEFKVGSDGVANGFGIAIEPEMGLEGRIWFERV